MLHSASIPHIFSDEQTPGFLGDFLLVMMSMLPMQTIWPHVIERHGGEVDAKFDYSTLAHISDGYSSGTIDQVSAHLSAIFAFCKPAYKMRGQQHC